ncbi:S-adenosyl-L-methionine-dependent methyltransferase [Mycena leptocephala]|nr:S-adenosyl-L-methionine-dependent methyltransferase [Mycena leptocephala]
MPKPDEDDDCGLPIGEEFKLFYEMHGRQFNTLNPTYLLPVDEEEIKRFNLFHRLIKFIFSGRIYVGPVKETLQFAEYRKGGSLSSILGLAKVPGPLICVIYFLGCVLSPTESMSWFSNPFQVYVTGVDVAPIQFTEVPPRCRFEIWDINTYDMPYEDGCFDLIHARQIARVLRPEGLVILIEPDLRQVADGKPEIEYTFGSGPRGWFTLWETYRSCLVSLEVDVRVPQQFKQLLEDTEMFESIEVHEGVIPVGFDPDDPSLLTVAVIGLVIACKELPRVETQDRNNTPQVLFRQFSGLFVFSSHSFPKYLEILVSLRELN